MGPPFIGPRSLSQKREQMKPIIKPAHYRHYSVYRNNPLQDLKKTIQDQKPG